MRVGIPKEIKTDENRVGLVPGSVREIVHHGHAVLVETGAGTGIGFADDDYVQAGARVAASADDVFAQSDLIVKVKEPQAAEIKRLTAKHILFTYLHLAPDPAQAKGLIASGCAAIAYETVTDDRGGLPLLAPMSEVAGRMSIQVAAHCLEKRQGGLGVLLGGVPGVPPAKVVILGGGISGTNAARMAMGLGAQVVVVDKSLKRLYELDLQFGSKLATAFATRDAIERHVLDADAVIGAVLVPGAAAPRLVTAEMVKRMRKGAVLVDISIDQGGCFETSRATTHENPTYIIDGVVHYAVANMPGAVPRTSAFALNNATLPFVLALADKGLGALAENRHLLAGLNVHRGRVTHPAVAEALRLEYHEAARALGS